ncbi:glycosyltransferase [Pontibacter diazotrophicus]|uniref:Glycosyltransferase n=1 Tax=Pontibacter diazotrophicus TaxID=1400979 RepID=A0A3D8LH01_9BACT|nr:glycosyltransferase family A protein [Pontibacter diazotrophicus]RDV16713.1 glycosyltransferase [Pontibacter diazotrophicus]
MQAHAPYHIAHIYLDQLSALPVPDLRRQASYLVFWWDSVALGHLFIGTDEKLSDASFRDKFIAAIRPAVEQYTASMHTKEAHWEELLQHRRYEEWKRWMDTAMSAWTAAAIPEKVPVSVVICTRDRASFLQNCLRQLSRLTCLPEEVIVVDNAPVNDDTKEVVLQFEGVTYVREPRPGLDIARNTGVLSATMPIVAYTDDDVEVHPLWVYRVWQTFQDKAVAAMTGLVIAAKLDTEAQLIFEKHWSFNRGFTDKVYDAVYFNKTLAKGPPVWEIGAGANMAFRKEVLEKVGLFDELLDVGAAGCNGDSEMWYRILESGHTILYNPRAVVHHEHRREIEGLKKQIFYYLRGFTTAALLQQRLRQEAGYKRHLFQVLPPYYMKLIWKGFPFYHFQYRTLWAEIKGVLSGLAFYIRNRRPASK